MGSKNKPAPPPAAKPVVEEAAEEKAAVVEETKVAEKTTEKEPILADVETEEVEKTPTLLTKKKQDKNYTGLDEEVNIKKRTLLGSGYG